MNASESAPISLSPLQPLDRIAVLLAEGILTAGESQKSPKTSLQPVKPINDQLLLTISAVSARFSEHDYLIHARKDERAQAGQDQDPRILHTLVQNGSSPILHPKRHLHSSATSTIGGPVQDDSTEGELVALLQIDRAFEGQGQA
jgi:hypothetical protein